MGSVKILYSSAF